MRLFRVPLCRAVWLAGVAALPLAAQTGPKPLPCSGSFVTISDAAGTPLFKVAATVVVNPADAPSMGVTELWYAGDDSRTPTAVFSRAAGFQLSAPSNPAANCGLADPPANHVYAFELRVRGQHVATLEATGLEPRASTSSLLFYNAGLQPDAFYELLYSGSLIKDPVVTVRQEAFCPLFATCDPNAPQPTPPPAPVPGTCGTGAAYGYLVLPQISTAPGVLSYGAKLPMWPPIDNVDECSVRQILFNVPDTMVDGLGTDGSGKPPQLQMTITGPSGQPRIKVYATSRQPNGGYVLYTVDAQTLKDVQVQGTYNVEITVTGQPKPVPPRRKGGGARP